MVDAPASPAAPLAPSLFVAPVAPIGWYFGRDDFLRLTLYNGASGVTAQLRGRVLPIGETTTRDLVRDLIPATDRSASTLLIAVGEGWLLDAEVVVTAGTPAFNQCFARLSVVRGIASSGYEIGELAAGAVTTTRRLAYPRSAVDPSIAGLGAIRSVAGTDPAANTEVSEVVPTGARWRLRSLDVALVTDANVANREVTLTIDDGTNIVAEVVTGVLQTATLTRRYSFTQHVQAKAAAAATIINAPAPDLILLAGWRIRTVTTAIQATDNYGAPRLCVEEWIEP